MTLDARDSVWHQAVDTRLSITHVAYASGFQSSRRFNAAFRQHFQMSPSEWKQRGTRE